MDLDSEESAPLATIIAPVVVVVVVVMTVVTLASILLIVVIIKKRYDLIIGRSTNESDLDANLIHTGIIRRHLIYHRT